MFVGLYLPSQAFKSNRIAVSGQLSLPAYFQVRFMPKHSFMLLYNFLFALIG
jgi:hypothetical protein